MAKRGSLNFCGIEVSSSDLELIEGTIRDCAGLSRTELAYTVCELLGWRRPNGSLKGHECRGFLEKLEEQGILQLPELKANAGKRRSKPKSTEKKLAPAPMTVTGKLSEVGPLELQLVTTSEEHKQWRKWVGQHHYLGYKVPFGAYLRYFVWITKPRPQQVGCLQVSSPAWRMAPRDEWIGWTDAQRAKGLQQIIQNSRFLILPWVKIPHLASASLARLTRRVVNDWQAAYVIRPILMETLVDPSRYLGTCYRAANWIYLGRTTGRGRMDKTHKRHGLEPKDIWVYPLCRKARERLLEDFVAPRLPDAADL
ncbi:DUF4338 domain-containing protein [Desulfoferrobacter suflitae]|uniref:DUF4338 domain-containing protein n=1 Tax=Desulfoferrobacter suflitae TaxID=2865782 RepID=UPI002164424C|nr:DUF4338 domain-containing protein [Desulfoferrobacter suflitae]MCK8601040.1 DUF4338 domain-containing protein [Desulfoferrobacter suflitae]